MTDAPSTQRRPLDRLAAVMGILLIAVLMWWLCGWTGEERSAAVVAVWVLLTAAPGALLWLAAAFGLTIDRAGWWQRSGILWLGPSAGPTALNRLVKSLWAALEPCGFWSDFRDFYPHVTIARRWRKARLPEIKPVHWPIDALALLESHTGQRGARYTVLERWPLSR